jgi:hypothetical protein
LKIIEAHILALDVKEIHALYMDPNFAVIFASKIVSEFLGETKLKALDGPL